MKLNLLICHILGIVCLVAIQGSFAQVLSKEDSLRLKLLINNSNSGEKQQSASNDRELDLQKLLSPVRTDLKDTVSVDSISLRKFRIDKMMEEKDSLRWAIDSLNKTIPDTVDSSAFLKPFGYEIFQLRDKNAFEPSPIGPVNPDYILGPGDELLVSIWGDRELNYTLIVDREGKISVPDIGIVSVNGTSLNDFKTTLIRKLSRVYSSLRPGKKDPTTFIDVSMGKLRTVRIYVFGNVVTPGGYNLSGNATVWNALFAAGGATTKGSLRKMKIIRDGKEITTVDGYRYLLGKGTISDDRMENHDVLYIPSKDNIIYLKGEIHSPAIYEILPDETIGDLISMAGGFTNHAYQDRIQVCRLEEYEKRIVIDIPYSDEKGKTFKLQPADSIFVFPAEEKTHNYFTINGEVARPERYELKPSLLLSQALKIAGGLTAEAYLGRVDVVHTYDDSSRSLSTFNLQSVLEGQEDTLLLNRDQIAVYSQWMFKKRGKVSIWGEVETPGYYDLIEGMSLEDLIFIAGGFTEKAYTLHADLSRIRYGKEINDDEVQLFQVNLSKDFNYLKEQEQFLLQNHDMIFVRTNPEWKVQRRVAVLGEVIFPGVYNIKSPAEKISNIIRRAGGIKKETAYLSGAVFQRTRSKVGRIALDLEEIILENKSKKDITLEDGDTIFIPSIPKTVKVLGHVGLPTSVLYKKGAGVQYYISNAGGVRENADTRRIKIILANGKVVQYSRWGFNPEINAGSSIMVDDKPPRELGKTFELLTRTMGTFTGLLTIALLVMQLNQK